MVENRPLVTVLSHVVMILGVLVIAFPVYVTFVASTHPLENAGGELGIEQRATPAYL